MFMFARPKVVAISVLVAGQLSLTGGPALGQKMDELRERFREECRAQFPHLSGPAHKEERFARVTACVRAKFAARAQQRARAPVSTGSELKLVEASPRLVAKNRGPGEAKGVIYFMPGWSTRVSNSPPPVPYFMRTLSEKGWDTLAARMPQDLEGVRSYEVVGRGAAFMRRRVRELKAQGYRRVILAGQSWGAWGALLAAHDPDFAADVLLLSAPSTFGQPPSPEVGLSVTEFPAALSKVRTPTVVILPDGDPFGPDPARRGAMAEKHFAQAEVAHLVLAKPSGFSGHLAAWLPVFDYAYGRCLETFIESPASKPCQTPSLSNKDFRSILDLNQVSDPQTKSIASAGPLVGKKFVVYALSSSVMHHYEYVSATQRKHTNAHGIRTEHVTFRNDLHCAGGQCSKLLGWSDGHLLEFEPERGKLRAWWVEHQ